MKIEVLSIGRVLKKINKDIGPKIFKETMLLII
jgi:hypothetical protein